MTSHVQLPPTTFPQVSTARRYVVLAVCCSSVLLASLDNTIINVALPSIARDLQASLSTLQWTVDAYLLVLAGLLMFSGSLADRFGRKRVFATGLTIFTVGSAMCGLSTSEEWLVAFRVVQAVGGSMLIPVALAIVTKVFTDPTDRARAIGWWAATSGVGIAGGPLIGGFLVDSAGWKSIFWLNVPIGVVAVIATMVLVPESKAAQPRRFDPVGQVLVVAFLTALIFGIIEGGRYGWTSPLVIGGLALAAATLVAIIVYESHRTEPLLRLELFSNFAFASSFAISVLGFFAFAGMLFANTLYLQTVRDLSPSAAGLLTLPLAAATIIAAPLSGRLLAGHGPRTPLLIAGAALTVGVAALLPTGAGTPVYWLILPYAVFGVGYGMLNAPINDAAVSELPDDQAGVAAGIVSTAKQVGSALGVAIIGSVLVTQSGGSLAEGWHSAGVLAWSMIACAGVLIVAITLGMADTPVADHGPVPERSAARQRM
nr:MFS transporter [Gordonia sp. LAM0048]